MMKDRYVIAIFAGATVAVIAVITVTTLVLMRHYGRIACESFSEQTGRQTKFVIYTTFDGGDCLTPTADGKWIPTRNLREFGED